MPYESRHAATTTTTSSRSQRRLPNGSFMSSVEDELRAPRFVLHHGRLLALLQHEILEHEDVHVRAHEAAIRVFRRPDDRLAADIERRVDDDRTAGSLVKRLDDVVVQRV